MQHPATPAVRLLLHESIKPKLVLLPFLQPSPLPKLRRQTVRSPLADGPRLRCARVVSVQRSPRVRPAERIRLSIGQDGGRAGQTGQRRERQTSNKQKNEMYACERHDVTPFATQHITPVEVETYKKTYCGRARRIQISFNRYNSTLRRSLVSWTARLKHYNHRTLPTTVTQTISVRTNSTGRHPRTPRQNKAHGRSVPWLPFAEQSSSLPCRPTHTTDNRQPTTGLGQETRPQCTVSPSSPTRRPPWTRVFSALGPTP